ncbi:hypothetical protein TorRG33x02_114820, partial [Trema orientale]
SALVSGRVFGLAWVANGGVGRQKRRKQPQIAASSRGYPTRLGRRWAKTIAGVASSAVWEDLGRSSWPDSTPTGGFRRSTVKRKNERGSGT